tara:strand:+ start:181 stop:357 length:177 start_codon:yes stop_codon:yes gene_type:complete
MKMKDYLIQVRIWERENRGRVSLIKRSRLAGLRWKEIADQLGVTRQRVHTIARKNGLL